MLRELIENLIFAMNFSDEVPERILEDIFKHNKNKNASVEHELETLTSSEVDDFNAEVDRKLKGVVHHKEALFKEIVGYADIKKLLLGLYLDCMEKQGRIEI
jgi:hypothetical protein